MPVTLSRSGSLGIIKISNPPWNILSKEIFLSLLDRAKEARDDSNIKIVVLTGGSVFSAGADVTEIYSLVNQGPEKVRELIAKANEVADTIESLGNAGKPVIATIRRACLGGGNEIAMACNYRIATPDTMFGQPEIKLGIIPGMGGTQRLPRLVEVANCWDLLLGGGLISAQEAKKIGLVDELVDDPALRLKDLAAKNSPGEILAKSRSHKANRYYPTMSPYISQAIVDRAKSNPYPRAAGAILEAVQKGLLTTLPMGLKIEQELFAEVISWPETKAGLEKFLQKKGMMNKQGKPMTGWRLKLAHYLMALKMWWRKRKK